MKFRKDLSKFASGLFVGMSLFHFIFEGDILVNKLIGNALGAADFTFQVDGMNVSFVDASANATNWRWDFGDGTTSTNRHPSHTYETGNYTICLNAEGVCGTDTHCENLQNPCILTINRLPSTDSQILQ